MTFFSGLPTTVMILFALALPNCQENGAPLLANATFRVFSMSKLCK